MEVQKLKSELATLRHEDDVSSQFSFVPPGSIPKLSDLCHALGVPEWRMTMSDVRNSVYRHALLRGIGCHHAGLGRRYRHAVEILFRKKKLRAVFATDSLAQ